jgi:DNA processing protein
VSPEFWHRLLAIELSPKKCRELLASLGTSVVSDEDAEAHILDHPAMSAADRSRYAAVDLGEFRALMAKGLRVLTEDDYPTPLRESGLTPPVLFAMGDPETLRRPTVAVVGTRNASTYGKAVAQKFGERLAEAGVTVVSGGALGIDAAAHKGALRANGTTCAVLITGLDRVYPREHAGLFRQIVDQGGCLISQFAVGTKSAWEHRPLLRNHTVAAISESVVVVEAPIKSGSLYTAMAANELGRPVFVVPANVDNVNFRGSHQLIRDGATLVDHPNQVLEAMGIAIPAREEAAASPQNDTQRRILATLSVQPLAPERIVEQTGLPTADVLAELTMLELEGRVIRDTGGFALRP